MASVVYLHVLNSGHFAFSEVVGLLRLDRRYLLRVDLAAFLLLAVGGVLICNKIRLRCDLAFAGKLRPSRRSRLDRWHCDSLSDAHSAKSSLLFPVRFGQSTQLPAAGYELGIALV